MISVVLLLSQNLFAKAYGSGSNMWANSIVQTSDSGYALAGGAWVNPYGIVVAKVSSDGSFEWAKMFGGSTTNYGEARSIVQTSDGGLVAAGWFWHSPGGEDMCVLKLSSDGSFEWFKTFGLQDVDESFSLIGTSDGGLVVIGQGRGHRDSSYDFFVLKLSSDGSLEWSRAIGGGPPGFFNEGHDIIQTADGGFLTLGYCPLFSDVGADLLLAKLSSDGSLQWANLIKGISESTWPWRFIQTSDGGYLVVGERSFPDSAFMFVVKLSSEISPEWAKSVKIGGDDHAFSVVQTFDGGIVVAGQARYGTSGDAVALKFSPEGSLEWAKALAGGETEVFSSAIQAPDSCIVLAGNTNSYGLESEAVLVMKLPPDGSYTNCVEDINPQVEDLSVEVVSVTPRIYDPEPTVMSLSPSITDVSMEVTEICESQGLFQGPRRPFFVYALSAPGGAVFKSQKEVKLRVYSANGRLVREMVLNEGRNFVSLKPGVYVWEASGEKGTVAVR